MKNLKEMCLVEGEVVFKKRVALLVTKEQAQNETYIEELLEEKSHEISDKADEVEYDNEVPVLISEDTVVKYYHETLGDRAWKEITSESTRNETQSDKNK